MNRTFLIALALAAACGSSAPKHSGYPPKTTQPWARAEKVSLADDYTAQVKGGVSYPERQRARWYILNLPNDGQLQVTLTFDGDTPETDLGLEILDYGFNVRAEGVREEDEGQAKKVRQVQDMPAGKAYVHVYTLGRKDAADFKLKIAYRPKFSEARSDFPNSLPNTPALALVPPYDDTPRRGRRTSTPPPPVTEVKPPPPKAETGGIRGSITEFREVSRGVLIVINRGQSNGVEEGREGFIVNAATGKPLKGGAFTVSKVRADECEAIVKSSLTEVGANRKVMLKAAAGESTQN